MGLATRKIHPERRGYGRRTERKLSATKARRVADHAEVDAGVADAEGRVAQYPWSCCANCGV